LQSVILYLTIDNLFLMAKDPVASCFQSLISINRIKTPNPEDYLLY